MSMLDRKDLVAFFPALALLIGMIALSSDRAPTPEADEQYLTRVSEAISGIPYRIGRWIGADVEAQAPAVRLLRPNKLLQRRYVLPDGSDSISLLVVHCSDARDMQGHYPPVCYPAHGWIIERSSPTDFAIGGFRVPAKVYELTSIRQGTERRMSILNFFVVPSESQALAADMEAVNRASAASARSGQGAAQMQLIVPNHRSIEDITRLMEEFAPALEPAIEKVIDDLQRRTT